VLLKPGASLRTTHTYWCGVAPTTGRPSGPAGILPASILEVMSRETIALISDGHRVALRGAGCKRIFSSGYFFEGIDGIEWIE
jgi:hypothetical protein